MAAAAGASSRRCGRWSQATPRPLRGALVAQAAVILLLVGFLAWSALRPAALRARRSAYQHAVGSGRRRRSPRSACG